MSHDIARRCLSRIVLICIDAEHDLIAVIGYDRYRSDFLLRTIPMDLKTMQSEEPPFLYLTTTGWKTGNQHEIEIWYVPYNGRYYIVSEREDRAHWVQNVQHNPAVTFRVGNQTFHG